VSAGGSFSWKRTEDLTGSQATTRVLLELQCMGIGRNDCAIGTNLVLTLDGLPRGDQKRPATPAPRRTVMTPAPGA